MEITWSPAADKRGIPHDEVVYAMSFPHKVVPSFGPARQGPAPTLFIGPSRFGTLEVLVTITPPGSVFVFHVMPLRASTAAEYEGEGT